LSARLAEILARLNRDPALHEVSHFGSSAD